MKKIVVPFSLALSLFLVEACKKKDEYANLNCASINASYKADIKPIIDANCTASGCHGTKSSNGDYTSYEGLLIRVNNGTLSKRVLYTKDMPQNGALSLQDRQKIKCWLNSGAANN